MDEREVWLAYAAAPGIGRTRLRALMSYFPSAAAAWAAPLELLAVVPGLDAARAAALVAARARPQGGAVLEQVLRLGGEMVLFLSPGYPPQLTQIADPPPFFFRLGPAPLDGPAVAVVGSRKATAYGLARAGELAKDLAAAGVTVISGLARGVDRYAHEGALAAGGRTVAVLGSGIDMVYPPEHQRLFAAMCETGAIVSEYPPGTKPEPWRFPERNRLISGLSLGTVVVEAGDKSGALNTVKHALDQNREVMALPGSANSPLSRGPHRLIQEGAALVTCGADVLACLRLGAPAGPGAALDPDALPQGRPLSPDEAEIYAWLSSGELHVDDLAAGTGLPAHRVLAAISLLELKGLARTGPGGQVMRT